MNKKTLITLIIILGIVGIILIISSSKTPSSVTIPETVNTVTNNVNSTPASTVTSKPTTASGTVVTAKIGQTVTVGGVIGTLTGLVEDSRCPLGVQCIQAGTVKVKVHLAYGSLGQDVTLTLGQAFSMSGHSITLTKVTPDKKEGVTIAPSDYVFTFSVK